MKNKGKPPKCKHGVKYKWCSGVLLSGGPRSETFLGYTYTPDNAYVDPYIYSTPRWSNYCIKCEKEGQEFRSKMAINQIAALKMLYSNEE